MVLLYHFIPVHQLILYPWNATGLIPLAIGIAFNASADNAFKHYGTTVRPFEESTALITTGAFKYSRNPMYLGMALILAGVAFLLGALSPFIIPPIFTIAMDRIFIVIEEQMLENRFGEQWQEYRNHVRRWL